MRVRRNSSDAIRPIIVSLLTPQDCMKYFVPHQELEERLGNR